MTFSNKPKINLLLYFILIATLCPVELFSQKPTDNQIKLGYIYNFIKNITWKDEVKIDTFKVAYLGEDDDFLKSIKSMENVQIRNKSVRVKEYSSLENLKKVQVLVVSNSQNALVKDINSKLIGENTLIITDRCEFQRYVMINFVYSADSVVKFEVNTKNMEDEGFTISPKLILLGGTEIDVRNLYRETEKTLITEKEKSVSYEKELDRKKQEVEDLNSDLTRLYAQLETMKKELAVQQNEIKVQQGELTNLKTQNNEQKLSINEKNITLDNQKKEIERREKQLALKEIEIQQVQQKILEHNSLLNNLKDEIDERQKTIADQGNILSSQQARIRSQRNFLILSFILIFIALTSVILIYRGFKIRKQQNTELEKQNNLVIEQRDQIAIQNQELEMHRTQLENLVQERTVDLIEAKEKAVESDRLKSSFLANMSHEIRTPLNAIIGFLELLASEETDRELRDQYTTIIRSNSELLLQLINDILDFAFIESGQMKIETEKINLSTLIQQLLSNYQTHNILADYTRLEIRMNIPDTETCIITDQVRFKQILTNLIDNALKYTERGYIEVGFELEENKVVIYVQDTGIGIPADKHKLIFDRFAKVEDSRKKLYRGVGLGLAICKKLVELLDGQIWIDSEPGKGSCFYFTQPVSAMEKGDQVQIINSNSLSSIVFSDKSILICEDDDSNYLYLKKVLSKNRITIHRAADGLEAIKFINLGNNPDLILMDIKMPNLDGIETTKKLKGEMGFKNPIIAQTAYATSYERAKYAKYFDAFITKPIIKEELYESLNNFLGQ
jgi:signal transduction histidine kinase/CheY-like chemotaxis protein